MQNTRFIVFLIALAAGLTSAAAGETPAEATKREFANCPGAAELTKLADVSWEMQASRVQDHQAFRARLSAPMPSRPTRILFWSFGAHLESVTYSVIAVRNAEGRWHTSGVGVKNIGIPVSPPSLMTPLDLDLSPEQAAALDQMLKDPCLYAAPTFQRNPSIAAGGAEQTLEIETPTKRRVAAWFGVRTPQQEAVINLIAQ